MQEGGPRRVLHELVVRVPDVPSVLDPSAGGTIQFVMILNESWDFLGALGASDRNEDEWILRPIVLWPKSLSGAQINWTT